MNKIFTCFFTKLTLFLAFFSFALSADLKATHSMGADLTYQCMGGNTYKLTLSFYRDCFGIIAPPNVSIDVTSVSCGYTLTATGNPIPGTGQEITPICPSDSSTCNNGIFTGIQEWIYEATITLPAACADWTFSYSLCCRNAAITTVSAPLSDNIYVFSMLNNLISPCNNSPIFSNKPVPFVCLGQQFCFNHGANDPDGDSLVYSLITPLSGPGTPVNYLFPYTGSQPLNSVPAMTFDPVSGDFCVTPQSLQVTVMAVLVSEYRNGVLIGQVERDLQITVISCTNLLPTATGINGTNDFTATVCANELLCFALYSGDPDPGQTVTMTWDNGINNGFFNAIGTPLPFGSFCWTPTLADVPSSPHCFTVKVQDDACPYFGSQIYSYCITVVNLVANAGPDQVVNCGSNATITATASGAQGALTYLWSNGFTGASQQAGPGTYIVTVTDGMCSDEDTVVVNPLAGPSAQYSFTSGCLSLPVSFTDQSTVTGSTSITSWSWNFGDGNSSVQQNPVHTYAVGGNYDVCLIVTTANGCIDSVCQNITVLSNAVAGFNFTDACEDTPVSFTNTSAPSGINYSWNFGNGTTSLLANPTANFTAPGNYNVTLIAGTGSGCPDTLVLPIIIYPQPLASFIVPPVLPCLGNPVTLTDNSTGNITSWNWQFGNGTSSQLQNPSVAYSTAGTYNVSLTVTTADGCTDSVSIPVTITQGITVNITPPVLICSGEQTTLIASGGTGYLWSNGSSLNSITVSPSVTTTYTVIVTDGGSCSGTAQVTVSVQNNPVITLLADTNICIGQNTLITASGGSSYLWNSGSITPSINVTPPATTVYSVTVTDANGCSSDSSITINVSTNPVVSIPTAFICSGNTTTLDAGNAGSTFLWNTGAITQTINVNTAGTYTVTVTNIAGCSSSASVAVNTGGFTTVAAQQYMCPGSTVILNAGNPGSSYLWTPGGATTQTIVVADTGSYSVLITDASGCTGTMVNSVLESPVPQPSFSYLATCSGLFTFSDATTISSGSIDAWNWDFGNGTASVQQNPSVTYTTPGTYLVSLTVLSDSGCVAVYSDSVTFLPNGNFSNTISDTTICAGSQVVLNAGNSGYNYLWSTGDTTQTINVVSAAIYAVTISDLSGCSASFSATVAINSVPVASYQVQDVCEGDSSYFINNSTISSGSIVYYQWLFGDASSTTLSSPAHLYTTFGNYNTQLIAVSDSGCSDTLQLPVSINAMPTVQFYSSNNCLNDSTAFDEQTTISSGFINALLWNFGDGTISTIQDPLHQYILQGSYPVQLIVTSNEGCVAAANDTVTIYPSPSPQINASYNCITEPVYLSNLDTSIVTSHFWNFGDGTTASGAVQTHTYLSYNTYEIFLQSTNQFGCISTDSILITPNAIPDAAFSFGSACEGNALYFTNNTTIAAGNVSYNWNFGDSSNQAATVNPVHIYAASGTYQVELIAESNSGCADSITLPVTVYAAPNVAFEPLEAEGCGEIIINFNDFSTAGSGNIVSWFWSFGDGTMDTLPDPVHLFNQEGSFDITLTVTNSNDCYETLTLPALVTVHPIPDAFFTADPPVTSILEPIYFINSSTGASQYYWDFGDGIFSELEHPNHTYSDSGHYVVSLIAVSEFLCSDSFEIPVELQPAWTIYVPNVFSPNADGKNEIFEIFGIGLTSYALEIYDRWGELLYMGYRGWDGIVQNTNVPAKQDVYVYKVQYTTIFGDKKNLEGRVTLLR